MARLFKVLVWRDGERYENNMPPNHVFKVRAADAITAETIVMNRSRDYEVVEAVGA